jgi:hypothetical protein
MKVGRKPSNRLAGNFILCRKQEGNRRVDINSQWIAVGQNSSGNWALSEPDHRMWCRGVDLHQGDD